MEMQPVSREFELPAHQPNWRQRIFRRLLNWSRLHPMGSFLVIAVVSNGMGSAFNILYNTQLIVEVLLDASQKQIFQKVALPIYNVLAYPGCLALWFVIVWPIKKLHPKMLAGKFEDIPGDQLEQCRKILVRLPVHQIWINSLGWFPGAIFFPLLICSLGGSHNAGAIWGQFAVSFVIAGLFTIVQTFFFLEGYLVRVLYPIYFQDARPAEVAVPIKIRFKARLSMLWIAVAAMPLVAMLVLALNFSEGNLRWLSLVIAIGGLISGGWISFIYGMELQRWLQDHEFATEEVRRGNFNARVMVKRPDEWGKLTDRFNDMTRELGEAEEQWETFGQIVHPQVRDAIWEKFPGLTVKEMDITVLFADIRGFTRRTAGAPLENVVSLLNRFLALAIASVESKGGLVNKFLGDGVMALFGTPETRPDHADLAVQASLTMVERLRGLNKELEGEGEDPLRVGIGIHSGLALAGCFGTTIDRVRREFSAIGETVNLAQRMEQFTKTLGGPILLTEQTKEKLTQGFLLVGLGEHDVPGYGGKLNIFKVEIEKERGSHD